MKTITTLAALSSALILTNCKNNKEEVKSPEPRPLVTYQVTAESTHVARHFTGVAKASEEVNLAFEVSGKIQSISVSVGDLVKKGDVLATLDHREFENKYKEELAEVKRSKAQYERMKKAAQSNAISKQELTNSKAAYDRALAKLDNKKKSLDDTEIHAPFDAVVVAKYHKNFSNIVAKDPVLRLIDPSTIEMVTHIPEHQIYLAQKGIEVELKFDALPDIVVQGKVTEVAAESNNSTKTYPVTLSMEQLKRDDGKLILPGMTGTAWVKENAIDKKELQQRIGFTVPVTALFTTPDGTEYVWVVNAEQSTVNKHQVKSIELSKEGVLIQGLKGGEKIARAGVHHLTDGQKVKLTNK